MTSPTTRARTSLKAPRTRGDIPASGWYSGRRRKIASKSRGSVALGKEAFYAQLDMPLSQAYDYASEVMTRNMLMADANEGICAFIDKRTPKWEP